MTTSEEKEPKGIFGISYTEMAITVVLLCIGCVLAGVVGRSFISRTLSPISENSPIPTQKARPNYRQMLEANGFAYFMDNDEGDPTYVSSCGALATVTSNYVGFAAYYDPNNTCAIEHSGIIVRIMYPSEVVDFIVASMNDVISKDTTVHGTVAGYRINIDFDPYDPKLIMTIADPQ